jgi:hypothetical protein
MTVPMADEHTAELQMNAGSLYREEVFTDRRVGTIHQLIPVTADGATDAGRPVLFTGQAQIMTAAGVLPISFEIEAKTLSEAVARFGGAAQQALEETVQELRELRRQAASSLVVPEPGTASAILGPGGMPAGGGGKIRPR